jgi:hypothetical protein
MVILHLLGLNWNSSSIQNLRGMKEPTAINNLKNSVSILYFIVSQHFSVTISSCVSLGSQKWWEEMESVTI